MKKEARNEIVKIFCAHYNLQYNSLTENQIILISEVYAPFLLFVECLNSPNFIKRNNQLDGFLIDMLHRSTNVFSSMSTLIALGHLQEAEVLSRTLAESALKIMHICKGEIPNNITLYLASYFSESSWKTEKWLNAVNNINNQTHSNLIKDRNEIEKQT